MSKLNAKEIGKRLKQLRGGMTQSEFATRIGSSLPAYQRYESGDRLPKHDILANISSYCSVRIDWILLGDHEDVIEVSQPIDIGGKGIVLKEISRAMTTRDGMTPTARRIFMSLSDLSEKDQRDILKHVEEKKMLNALKRRR